MLKDNHTFILQKIASFARRFRSIAKVTLIGNKIYNNFITTQQYRKNLYYEKIQKSSNTKIAVVIHLFYIDTWPVFEQKLRLLSHKRFDLFITMPKDNLYFTNTIMRSYKNAHIFEVPNRGRDVLPFVKLLPLLVSAGYKHVLKMHSKKSTHRNDGSEWLTGMIDSLIPKDSKVLSTLLSTLEYKQTGIIGPSGQYIPLPVNFEINGKHMTKALKNLYSKKLIYDTLQNKRMDYGFFAGTMFWARLDALIPILNMRMRTSDFETEDGQIDGTMAHALERLFCMVSEIEGRSMYEASEKSVKRISYKTDNIPKWSDLYRA